MNRRKQLLILSALFACVLGLLTALGGTVLGAEPPGLEVAKAAQERHTDNLLQIPGVVGTAIGMDEKGDAVVDIFAEHPGIAGVPDSLDGVPARIHVTEKIYAQADPTSKFDRPVPIGVSTGSDRLFLDGSLWYCSSGTLGARVVDRSGKVYALSNNHVYAQENLGEVGDLILQPGRADMAGCGTDAEVTAAVIGALDSWVDIDFSESANNIVDAAIGLTDADSVGTGTPDDGYGTPTSTLVEAQLGQLVQKYGRTTGLTYGKVTGVHASVLISYSTGTAKFVDQVIVSGTRGAFSKGGDSGSLIVTRGSNNPVALLFAGSNTITIGNPIAAVLDAFHVSIDSGVLPTNSPVIKSITPNTMPAGTRTNVTIRGTGFVPGASVTLENGSGPAPSVSNVVVTDSTTISATIKTNRKSVESTWDVRVTNPDGLSDVLVGAFTVTR
jgi:hypothetical protein